jgi:uncharacterized protein (TIRG00374 family)
MKNALKLLFKLGFALGLIYWLVDSGKLDFNILNEVLKDPIRLIIAFMGLIFVLALGAFRLRLILEHKSEVKIPFLRLIKYNWIGMFFNAVLPGSVSGDIVKIFYIKDEDKSLSNRFLFATVLIDRFVGLFGLIITLGLFTLINYTELTNLSVDIKKLLDLNLVIFVGVIFGLLSLFFFQGLPEKLASPFKNLPLLDKIIPKILDAWNNLCMLKHRMVALTFISVIIQSMAVVLFWYIVHPYSDGVFPFQYAFSLIPVGFVAISIPIAPSGLGVGHAVFHTLFGYIGIKNGADLFNIYFFMVLGINLLGAIPYLYNKSKKVHMEDLKDLEEHSSDD